MHSAAEGKDGLYAYVVEEYDITSNYKDEGKILISRDFVF